MAEDNRDFIERSLDRSRVVFGKEFTPAEMASELAREPLADRLDIIDDVSRDDGELTVNEAARRLQYRNALLNMHELLRKVGR